MFDIPNRLQHVYNYLHSKSEQNNRMRYSNKSTLNYSFGFRIGQIILEFRPQNLEK